MELAGAGAAERRRTSDRQLKTDWANRGTGSRFYRMVTLWGEFEGYESEACWRGAGVC